MNEKILEIIDAGLDDSRVCSNPRTAGGDGSVLLRCWSKYEKHCPSCASLYKTDVKRILGSGFDTGDEIGGRFRFYFWTLTAPSFGYVHRESVRCGCGRFHKSGSGWRGIPQNPETYDYEGQVRWNAQLGTLWNKSTTYLQGHLSDVEFASVREWQVRGALHVHALVRVPSKVDASRVIELLHAAAEVTSGGVTWGDQVDARLIKTSDSLTHGVRYLAKALTYSIKSLTDEELTSDAVNAASYEHLSRLGEVAREIPCRKPRCEDVTHSMKDHPNGVDCEACGCPSLFHRRFGFGGHRFVKSRNWSLEGLNFTKLHEQRADWWLEMRVDEETGELADIPVNPVMRERYELNRRRAMGVQDDGNVSVNMSDINSEEID